MIRRKKRGLLDGFIDYALSLEDDELFSQKKKEADPTYADQLSKERIKDMKMQKKHLEEQKRVIKNKDLEKNKFDLIDEQILKQRIDLKQDMSEFQSKVDYCNSECQRVIEICNNMEKKTDIGKMTINKVEKRLEEIYKEMVGNNNSAQNIIGENKGFCIDNQFKHRKEMTVLEKRVNDLEMWRDTLVKSKFAEIDSFMENSNAKLKQFQSDIDKLFATRVENVTFQNFQNQMRQDSQNFDIKLDKQRDDQLTLEHYCERYIPIQIQNMIIDNMNLVLKKDQLDVLKSEQNKLYRRIQEQIMDNNNFTAGSLFENIMKINEDMASKLKVKVDLRRKQLCGDDQANSLQDLNKQYEKKLEKYILEFINLNADNQKILNGAMGELDKMLQKRIDLLDVKLTDNVKEMRSYAVKDGAKTSLVRNELEKHVQEMQEQVQKLEQKRLKDMQAQLQLMD